MPLANHRKHLTIGQPRERTCTSNVPLVRTAVLDDPLFSEVPSRKSRSMRIDRATYVTLVSAIAAWACAAQRGSEGVRQITVVDIPPAATSSMATTALSEPPPKSAAVRGPAEDYQLHPFREGGADEGMSPDEEGMAMLRTLTRPGAHLFASCGHSSLAFDGKRTGCRDTVGGAPRCNLPRTSVFGCASTDSFDFRDSRCKDYAKYFLPGVAKRAEQCLAKLRDASACDSCLIYRCGYDALFSACPDITSRSFCAKLARANSLVKIDECLQYTSGLNAAGRKAIEPCVEGGTDFYSCIESL